VDFELDEEQLELQRVVRDIAARECPTTLVRSVVAGDDDGSALWKTFVELDWPSLTVPEADGGMGMTAVELVIVLEELGRVADPTPFLATTSQYVPLVRACAADPAARRDLLGAVCSGATGAVAFAADDVRARPDGDGWVLDGTTKHVVDGDRADEVAVVAGTVDDPSSVGAHAGGRPSVPDQDGGVGVFVVPAAAVTAARTPAFDGSFHVADVAFDGVRVAADRAFTGASVAAGVDRARDEATAGLAAVMVGASQRVLDLVLDHVKERQQFGVPIGSFQAVKHMAVDMYVAIERARALVHFAGLTVAEDDPRRALAASLAKAAAGDCQRLVAKHGIQLFGGLGFTWENDLQVYVRRTKVGEPLLGSTHEHRARAARLVLAGQSTSGTAGGTAVVTTAGTEEA
jgi:alkylation response protein AidB-like acyl-CoA dehydrogenase